MFLNAFNTEQKKISLEAISRVISSDLVLDELEKIQIINSEVEVGMHSRPSYSFAKIMLIIEYNKANLEEDSESLAEKFTTALNNDIANIFKFKVEYDKENNSFDLFENSSKLMSLGSEEKFLDDIAIAFSDGNMDKTLIFELLLSAYTNDDYDIAQKELIHKIASKLNTNLITLKVLESLAKDQVGISRLIATTLGLI